MVHDDVEKVVMIRETRESDIQMVGELERKCKFDDDDDDDDHNNNNNNNNNGASCTSILTDRIVDDPLCRIRFYPLHLMLVAEIRQTGELIGVISGCIKHVASSDHSMSGGSDDHLKFGCILGLRVSPTHRRLGIGLKLVKAMEEWMTREKTNYTFLATEKSNLASTTLFTLKCNYKPFNSLLIFVHPVITSHNYLPGRIRGRLPEEIRIHKLRVSQAISLYETKLRGSTAMYPTDMEAILEESLNLGTWVLYFKQEKWSGLESDRDVMTSDDDHDRPSSWIVLSIWSTTNSCKKHDGNINQDCRCRKRGGLNLKSLAKATMSCARDNILPCLKLPSMFCDAAASIVHQKQQLAFGLLFLYGLYGEGDRVGELMRSAWRFALRLARNVKGCKVVVAELGASDPLVQHVPRDEGVSCIEDVWYLKKASNAAASHDHVVDPDNREDLGVLGQVGNVFVDPRDL